MFNILTKPSEYKTTTWGYEIKSEFKGLPFVGKIISSKDGPLSVQMHPTKKQAAEMGLQCGKSEFWYVLEAEEDSYIYIGMQPWFGMELPTNFKGDIINADNKLKLLCKDGSIIKYLKKFKAIPGQLFVIPAGVLHCLGKGITVFEMAQNCDITYRVYDHGRDRELHLDKLTDFDLNLNMNFQFLLD